MNYYALLVYFQPFIILNKTVINLFSTGCRRVSSRRFRDQCGGGKRGNEVWNLGTMFSKLAKRSTRMLVRGIFKELRTFIVVPDVLGEFSTSLVDCRVRTVSQ